MVDSFINIRHESPVKELSHDIVRKHTVTVHGAPGGRKAYTMGCGLVPQGGRLRHCYDYPNTMQPSAQYLPL